MSDLNWPLAVKRLYFTLWAFGVVAGAIGFVIVGYEEGVPPWAYASFFFLFFIVPASVFFAGRWIFRGLKKSSES